MRRVHATLLAGAVLSCAGCRTLASRQEVPAIPTNPTPEGRAELRRDVSDALHGATVTIADDALTRTCRLTIERTHPRDLDREAMTGRELGRPEQLLLVTNESRCMLVHQASGRHFDLARATCAPLKPAT